MEERQILYKEELTASELDFLLQKDEKETKNFYKVISIFMVICFIIPFMVAWVRAVGGEGEFAFSYIRYFSGVVFLLSFLGFCAYLAYNKTLQKIKRDIKRKSKTVERAKITRKQHVKQTGEYFFYLDSPNKLSIEVTEGDYYMLSEGDEVNIEYSTNAKLYFGYF